MAGSAFDSALYGRLFDAGDAGRLFTDTAEVRAMLLVEGALAKAQGALGVIPETAAAAIGRAAVEIVIDPGALAKATGTNGVAVPTLVAAFRSEMNAPEHAQFVHWGATSQDISDTALMLRLRQALTRVEGDLRAALTALADTAERHAGQPMAARTYGQHATVTSFGSVAAGWGAPLLALLGELPTLRRDCLLVSLSGAAGTGAALGDKAAETRAALASGLDLGDPARSWHADRTPVLRLADWFLRVSLAFAKMGEDCTELAMSGIGEVALGGAGGSSTMPQKQNPVAPSVLIALGRQGAALMAALHGAGMPRHQRDGAAWFTEWLCLPQIVLGAATSARSGRAMLDGLAPQAQAIAATLTRGLGMIHAEALSFALAETLPRPEAQAAVKKLCAEALETGTQLRALVERDHPNLNAAAIFDDSAQMGHAPGDATGFARAARDWLAAHPA